MRVKKLSLTNWRSISRANCSFGNVNFIFGKNNEGKSSLIYGIEYALSNKSAIASDIAILQKTGTSECNATIELDKIGSISRYKKSGNQMNRLNGELVADKVILEEISKTFDLDYDTIGIMFDASRFTKMSKKEQKAFLLRLTGISLDAEKIIQYMNEPSSLAQAKVRNEIGNKNISIDDIAEIYKTFYSSRSFVNKKCTEIKNTIKVFKENCIKDKPRQIQYIKADIEKIALALKEIEQTITIYNERLKQRENLEKTIKLGEDNYKVVEGKLNEKVPRSRDYIDKMEKENKEILLKKSQNDKNYGIYSTNLTSAKNTLMRLMNVKTIDVQSFIEDESIELVENIDIINEANTNHLDKKHKNEKEIEVLRANIVNAKTTLTKLQTTKCPLSENIVCNYDKKPMLDELMANISSWEKSIETMEKENKEIDNTILNNTKKIVKYCQVNISTIETTNATYNETLELNEKKKKSIENQIKIVEWLDTSKKELDARKLELKNIELPNIDGLISKKQCYEQDKHCFDEELKQAEKYTYEQKQIKDKEEELKKVEDEFLLYEYLVTEFAPNGVRSRILKKIIAPIVDVANERLKILASGYSIEFNFDKDFDIYITNNTGTLLFEHLSISEQLRIQVILQDAINQLTNVGLMVVDEAGILDDANFIQLLDLVKEIAPSYGNIFIVATKDKDEVVKLSEHIYSTSDDASIFYIEKNEVFRM